MICSYRPARAGAEPKEASVDQSRASHPSRPRDIRAASRVPSPTCQGIPGRRLIYRNRRGAGTISSRPPHRRTGADPRTVFQRCGKSTPAGQQVRHPWHGGIVLPAQRIHHRHLRPVGSTVHLEHTRRIHRLPPGNQTRRAAGLAARAIRGALPTVLPHTSCQRRRHARTGELCDRRLSRIARLSMGRRPRRREIRSLSLGSASRRAVSVAAHGSIEECRLSHR